MRHHFNPDRFTLISGLSGAPPEYPQRRLLQHYRPKAAIGAPEDGLLEIRPVLGFCPGSQVEDSTEGAERFRVAISTVPPP
jgi:hypothetical protein